MFETSATARRVRERGICTDTPAPADDGLRRMDELHAQMGRAFREMLALVLDLERTQRYRAEGARDTAHLLQMRYGYPAWRARRIAAAASALRRLPAIARALADGVLGPDKALELARFATPQTEEGLVAWAIRVSYATVRRRGDLLEHLAREEVERIVRQRSCSWFFYDGGRRFHLEADLPAVDGARLAAALDEAAARIPVMPGEEEARYAPARRADALVALCSHGAGSQPVTADDAADGAPTLPAVRATVVVHATVGTHERPAEIDGGGVAHPAAVERLACSGAVEHLHEDRFGRLLHRIADRRVPPAWMARQVRYRDGGCTFPGCGTRAFTEAHHIVWHRFGGRTALENLTLLCSFHHRLVHEGAWRVRRSRQGELLWTRPDGSAHAPWPVPRGRDVDPVEEPVIFGLHPSGSTEPGLAAPSLTFARTGPAP